MFYAFLLRYAGVILVTLIFCQPLFSAEIKSKPQGGNWHSASTWEGDIIPAKNDNVTIDAVVYLNSEMTESDSCLSLTITENGELRSFKNTLSQLHVLNELVNYGRIFKETDDNFILMAHGDLMNYGNIDEITLMLFLENKSNYITGTFNSLTFFEANTDTSGLNFIIIGKTEFLKTITIQAPVIIENSAVMKILVASWDGIYNPENLIVNKGTYIQQTIRNLQFTYFDTGGYLNLKFADIYGECTDPKLITHGSQCHPRMKSSVSRWWRLSAENENDSIDPYILELTYDDALLNGIEETKLHVYLSKDEGITWEKISNTATIIRNTEDNVITIGTESDPVKAGGGDIILASGEEDVTIPSSISVSIIGPDEIRIGAPNLYKIAYWNNGTVNTGTFFVKVKLDGGIEIDKMISHYPNDNTPVEYSVEDINPYNDNTYGFFLVDGLGSKEYSSFDLILNCQPDGKASKSKDETQVLPAIAVVGLYLAGGIVADYVTDVMVGSCYEIIFNDNTTVMDAAKNIYNGGIKKTNAKYTVSSPVKAVGSSVVEDLLKQTAGIVLWPANMVVKFWDCLDDIAEGLNDANAKKNPKKVNAWDPNSKSGPVGFGDENFMSSINPMIYMIKFENLKDATAPAYKVVIEDVLDEKIFDLSSIEPVGMSHQSGNFSIDGNKLIWEFTGIELPPNVNPPEGEGWVSYKINLHNNLESGTVIKNKAVITFDLNEPIETNETINTLDFDSPFTEIDDLPDNTSSRSINLNWAANDGMGSGVDFSYIYASIDNGPFTMIGTSKDNEFKTDITPGHNYRFFVLSKDYVGNVENKPKKIVSTNSVVNVLDKEELNFSISPNPSRDYITITHQATQSFNPSEGSLVEIFDMLGVKLISESIYPTTSGRRLNIEKLPSGVYFIKIGYNGMKLIKY